MILQFIPFSREKKNPFFTAVWTVPKLWASEWVYVENVTPECCGYFPLSVSTSNIAVLTSSVCIKHSCLLENTKIGSCLPQKKVKFLLHENTRWSKEHDLSSSSGRSVTWLMPWPLRKAKQGRLASNHKAFSKCACGYFNWQLV